VVTIIGTTAIVQTSSVRAGNEILQIEAEVRVQLVSGAAESRWTIQLNNRDRSKTIFAVTLPRLSGVRLGERREDDALYFPLVGGERIGRAVEGFVDLAEKRFPSLETGLERVVKQKDRYVYELKYAGRASMRPMFT